MSRVEVTVPVDIAAPAEDVWEAVTDWPGQGEWMLGTRVAVEGSGDGRRLGARLRAVTGVGPLRVTDTMEIVEWEPPRRAVVVHTGKVVRGDGVIEVVAQGDGRARLMWTERLDLPLGAVGAVGWRAVAPAFRWGIAHSLAALARRCEAAHRG